MTQRRGSGATGSLSNDAAMAAPSFTPPRPGLPSLAGGPPLRGFSLGSPSLVLWGHSQSFGGQLTVLPPVSAVKELSTRPFWTVPRAACSRLRKRLSALSLPSIWSGSHGLWQVCFMIYSWGLWPLCCSLKTECSLFFIPLWVFCWVSKEGNGIFFLMPVLSSLMESHNY